MVRNSLRDKYRTQKRHAKRRNIEFTLTFEDWVSWWGDDIDKRGRGMGRLQMCRKDDTGPYSIENIFKATHEQNQRDKVANGTNRGKPKVLNKEEVEEVLFALHYGQMSTRYVARAMGVSQRTIMRVKKEQGAYT